ncbi:MAG: transposase family protein [Segetibacter sp.]|nr:transposase family protein [Segetibacter sp.]
MQSPIKYFAAVNEFRQLGKVRHKLENIIAITIAAVICGCENWYEIEWRFRTMLTHHSGDVDPPRYL